MIVPFLAKKFIAPSVAVTLAFFTVKVPSEYNPIDLSVVTFTSAVVPVPSNFPVAPFTTIP